MVSQASVYCNFDAITRGLSVGSQRHSVSSGGCETRDAQVRSGRARSFAHLIGLCRVKPRKCCAIKSAAPALTAKVKPSSGVYTSKTVKLMPLHQQRPREKHLSKAFKKDLAKRTSAPKFGSEKLKASLSRQHPGRSV